MTTKLTAHRGAIYCISVVGTNLFSGSYDNTIRVWDLKTMECVQVLKGHTSKVEAICTSLVQAQTPMMFSGSSDHSVKV
jgi:WD40 repeat protein